MTQEGDTPDAAAMVATMARMQSEHNEQVHPQWRSQGYEYYRAIWVECAEMLDHFGWKWWKHQQPDIAQVQLELVDIWHFALSDMIRADELDETCAQQLAAVVPGDVSAESFRAAIETMAGQVLQDRKFALPPFLLAMASLPMDLDTLFGMYVGKNVLNRFRQDHGYKDGSYRKLWAGREDNEHLVELLAGLDGAPDTLAQRLYEGLEIRYGDA